MAQFKCGILIADLVPKTIHEAITEIRNNYEEYASSAIAVAKDFSFDKAIKPYLEFVKNTDVIIKIKLILI